MILEQGNEECIGVHKPGKRGRAACAERTDNEKSLREETCLRNVEKYDRAGRGVVAHTCNPSTLGGRGGRIN